MIKGRIAVPDFVSNSYFPAIAAVELGLFAAEGVDAQYKLIFPNNKAYEALRDGTIDLVAGPAHALLPAFPEWRGAKLLMALSQGTFWMLVMRADLAIEPGDINAIKGKTIGAAPFVDLTFKRLLIESGIDLENDGVKVVGIPAAFEPGASFGVTAARALEDGLIDGFWANAMGAENAVQRGVGKIILDVRRGLGPKFAFDYTLPVLATSDRAIAENPELIAAAVRAVVAAQGALRTNIDLAGEIGRKVFPPVEAGLIQSVIARDLPFYQPQISDEAVNGLIGFSRNVGLLIGTPSIDDVVARQFRPYWKNGETAP